MIFLLRQTSAGARSLIVGGFGVAAGLVAFAGLVQDVLGQDEFFFFDGAALAYLDENRVTPLIDVARVVNRFTGPVWTITLAAIALLLLTWKGRSRQAIAVGAALSGQWVIVEVVERFVQRAPPPFMPLAERAESGFPSGHMAALTALLVIAAWPWERPPWPRAVARFGAVALTVLVVATARIVLLVEYPSDVLSAVAVATAWALLVGLVLDSPGPAIDPADGDRLNPRA